MTDVKLLRLTTGEDIVAEVTNQQYSDNDKTVTTIKKTFCTYTDATKSEFRSRE